MLSVTHEGVMLTFHRPMQGLRVVVLLSLVLLVARLSLSQATSQLRFHAQVVLVPVDVRVVRGDGEPVTDLAASDFALYENGVRQPIAHFASRPQRSGSRTFAVVLGRGSLNSPVKAIDALLDFVRRHLLPEDRLCVFAYLRATELSTDHAAVLHLLERYRAQQDDIERRLWRDERRNPVGGIAGPDRPPSQDTQLAIQSLFEDPGIPAIDILPGGGRSLSFSDSNYLMCAIDLLAHIEGEKHVILVSERAPGTGRGDFLARKAATARVSVSVLQTGGLSGPQSAAGRFPPVATGLPSDFDDIGRTADVRSFAAETGGIAAFHQTAEEPLLRLAKATQFQYLLGYYPAKPPDSVEYRQLKVVVKRRGLALLYRHGYAAVPPPELSRPDVRRIFLTTRISNALSLASSGWTWTPPRGMREWNPVSRASVSCERREDGSAKVFVDFALDTSLLGLTPTGDQYNDVLDVAVFAEDAQGRRIGEKWEQLAIQRPVLAHQVTASVTGSPMQVRMIVYHYGTDRTKVTILPLK